MNYGYFDDTTHEYVITNPRTPTKWINYIGTLQFGGYVDHTGGASGRCTCCYGCLCRRALKTGHPWANENQPL